ASAPSLRRVSDGAFASQGSVASDLPKARLGDPGAGWFTTRCRRTPVLWVVREVISGEILVARALLSSSQEDRAVLLREAKEMLPASVPVSGILSDGQLSIRKAVAAVFACRPHQFIQFHCLLDQP